MRHVTRILSGAVILALAAGCSPQQQQQASQTGERVGERVATGTRDVAQKAGQGLSNASLAAKVRTKMGLEKGLQTKRIDVEADASTGTVRLEGSVPDMNQRALAERVANSTEGVKQVVNHLAVPPTAVSANPQPSTPK